MGLLSIFGINGKATVEQSEKSYAHIVSALSRRVEDVEKYTIVFGYSMKTGVLSTKIGCYAIGFSWQDLELAIVPIYCDSNEIEDLLLLKKEDIKAIKRSTQGEKIIKSNLLSKDLRIMVPSLTLKNAEDQYMLPINQTEKVAEFEKWIKENF